MKKPTPNPPETDTDPTSPYATIDSRKLNEAADRALDHYLKPTIHIMASARVAEPMYLANPVYITSAYKKSDARTGIGFFL
jgi:hypothetical protein